MSSNGVGFRSERGPVLIALMMSTSLVAIDSTIIATAVPSIVKSIGGFSQFPWLFSIYLLAQAVSVPVYGKLADLFGRKPVMLFGILVFLLGSILCGAAWNMTVLIAFRVIQGLGAGAVQPMSITIVGDLYSLQERAKVQGYLASVWGLSSVIGPTMGGVFSEYISWRWIFIINIPLCLLAAALLIRNFEERVPRGSPRIDYRGAGLLTTGCTLLILGVLEGGQSWAWLSPPGLGVPVLGALLLLGFVRVERRTAEPVLPLWVFTHRLLLTCSLTAAAVGAIVLGLTSYIPTFVQDVLGTGPVVAGFALAALTLGWPISASQAGRIYLHLGFRACALIGSALVLLGCALLSLLGSGSNVLEVGGSCWVIGLGMGLVASPTLIAAQSAVGWQERGVVTGNNLFCRSLGSAVGVAIFGAIANGTAGGQSRAHITLASQHVFLAVGGAAVLMTIAVCFIPRRIETDVSDQPATGTDAFVAEL